MKDFKASMVVGLVFAMFAGLSSAASTVEKPFGDAYSIKVYDGEVLKWSGHLGPDKQFINEKFEDDPKAAQCAEADVECSWRANGSPFFYLERRVGLQPEFGLGRMYGINTYHTADGQQKLSIPDIRERGWHLPLDEDQTTKEFYLRGASVGAANVTYRVIITKDVASVSAKKVGSL